MKLLNWKFLGNYLCYQISDNTGCCAWCTINLSIEGGKIKEISLENYVSTYVSPCTLMANGDANRRYKLW